MSSNAKPVLFEVFLAPTHLTSVLTDYKGPAAAAWGVRPIGDTEQGDRGVFHGKSQRRDNSAALVGALLEVLGNPVVTGNVEVYCAQEWLCRSINEWAPGWRAGGWQKPDNHQSAWKEYFAICDRKGIQVHATFVRKDDQKYEPEFALLHEVAKIDVERRAREQGHPSGGFEPVDPEGK